MKLLDYDDFLYTNVAVRRPLRLWFEHITDKYDALCDNEDFNADDKKNLKSCETSHRWRE